MPGLPLSGPLRAALLGGTALVAPLAAAAQSPPPGARPALDRVVAGGITLRQDAARTQVTQAEQRGIVEWRSFDIGRDHHVQFQQPSARSVTLNRVTTPVPSLIAGRLTANGQIAIVNQSGVVFSQGAQVEAAGLVASAAGITNQNFLAGRMVFDQPPRPGARVENHGSITVRDAGLAALVAPQVANRGTITARLGRVSLAGAETHTVDLYGDGMMAVEVTGKVRRAPDGGAALVTNTGTISAEGGTVQLTAAAVDGIVQDLVRAGGRVAADTDAATGRAGRVVIAGTGGAVRIEGEVRAMGTAPGTTGGSVAVLGDRVRVEATGRVDASGAAGGGRVALGTEGPGPTPPRLARRTGTAAGAVVRADATLRGKGGTVLVNSAEYTEHAGSISARGGPQGGDGGFVEVSGQRGLRTPGRIDTRAPAGAPGTILLDPEDIRIVFEGSTSLPPDGVLGPGDPPANASLSASDIAGFTGDVVLGATRDIFVLAPLTAGSTVGSLTMTAGRDLEVNAPISGFAGLALTAQGGDLRLNAGLFDNGATTLAAGGAVTVGEDAFRISAISLLVTAGSDVTLGPLGSAFASLTLSGGAATINAGRDVTIRTPLVSDDDIGVELTVTARRDIAVDRPVRDFAAITLAAATDGSTLGLIPGGAGALAIRSPVVAAGSSGAILLQAGSGGITQAPPPLQAAGVEAATLSLRSTGDVTLNATSGSASQNRIDVLDASQVDGNLLLRVRAFIDTIGAPVALRGTIAVGGQLTLTADNGVIQAAQPSNRLATPDLVLTSGAIGSGTFDLSGDNIIGRLAFLGGDLTLRSKGDLQIGPALGISARDVRVVVEGGSLLVAGGIAGDTIQLQATGNMQVAAPVTGSGGVQLRAGGSLTLASTGGAFGSSAAPVTLLSGVDFSTGATDLAAAGGLVLAGTVQSFGGSVELGAGRDGIAQTGAGIRAARLTLRSGGDALLGQPGNAIGQLGALQAAGDVLLDNGTTSLAVQGPGSAASIGLRTQGTITVQQGATLAASGPGGRIAVRSGPLTFQPGAAIAAALVEIAPFVASPVTVTTIPGAIAASTLRIGATTFPDTGPDPVTTATAIDIAAPLAFAGRLDLRSTGTIAQATGAGLTLGSLSGAAGGPVSLADPGNAIGVLAGFTVTNGASFALANARDLALAGPLAVPGGTVRLAVAGRLSQGANGAINAGLFTGQATGGAALDAAANDLAALGPFDAGVGPLSLVTVGPLLTVPGGATVRAGAGLALAATGGALTVDGTVSGEDTSLRAATELAVSGFSAIARSGDLLLAADRVVVTGLIQAGRALSVEAGSLASLAGQATIVAPPGGVPGGLTVSAPRIALGGLDARAIPVILALGAEGTATGALDAGGLIVRGGAGARLTGSIGGIGGGEAAALGRRETAAGSPLSEPLPRAFAFTLNDCPIGAAACLPEAVLVPLAANPAAVIAVLDPANLVTNAERLRPRAVLPEMRIARDRSEQEELAPPDIRRDDY